MPLRPADPEVVVRVGVTREPVLQDELSHDLRLYSVYRIVLHDHIPRCSYSYAEHSCREAKYAHLSSKLRIFSQILVGAKLICVSCLLLTIFHHVSIADEHPTPFMSIRLSAFASIHYSFNYGLRGR